ncbi:hypothetical protein [Yeosuana aromativorans]|uniref:hypothetical protein n=1 Tax=Yeosuana aromativorans TaxID=288019 RepID=UPI00166BFC16|nr:hypothetical protein [Yeosuana aromativorans]
MSTRSGFQGTEAFQMLQGLLNFTNCVPIGIYNQVTFQVPEVMGFKVFTWVFGTVDDCYKNYIQSVYGWIGLSY